jgi:hypothetical protein
MKKQNLDVPGTSRDLERPEAKEPGRNSAPDPHLSVVCPLLTKARTILAPMPIEATATGRSVGPTITAEGRDDTVHVVVGN